MLLNHVEFLDDLIDQAESLGIDLSGAKIDHLGFSTSSSQEYDEIKPELEKISQMVKEAIVGDRRVGIFKFDSPLGYKGSVIHAIELVEPKDGEDSKNTGLEHAEFLLDVSLEEFADRYPDVNWDKKNINRDEYPRLKLVLPSGLEIKFPREPILSDGEL